MISKVSTLNMTHEDWLKARRKSIGGSDAAALLGLNPYTSPYMLWAEKAGIYVPEDIDDREAVRVGRDLEQYVAERFTEATEIKLRRCNAILYNDEFPFAHANIDRAVIGERAGFEAKTTSSWEILTKCRGGEYPPMWYAQMCHYMMVTGWEKWYLGVLVLGKGFFHFTIERNEAEIAALASAEREFWAGVGSKTPPPVDGSESTTEALNAIFPDSESGAEADLTQVADQVKAYTTLDKQIKTLSSEKDRCKAEIMACMQDAERGSFGAYKVSWKSQTSLRFDRAAYEAEMGAIPQKYFKQSKSRPFRLTVKEQ